MAGSIAILICIAFFSTINNALATQNPQTSPAMLEECEQLGIEPENCTESNMPDAVSGTFLTLVGFSTNNMYEARVEWYHNDIGSANGFSVTILDPNQLEPRVPLAVTYDIRIYKGDEYLLPVQQVIDGDKINDYNFIFPEPGSYTLTIAGLDGGPEKIEIPMQVTPEFPMATMALISATGLIITTIVLSRSRFSWRGVAS